MKPKLRKLFKDRCTKQKIECIPNKQSFLYKDEGMDFAYCPDFYLTHRNRFIAILEKSQDEEYEKILCVLKSNPDLTIELIIGVDEVKQYK